MKIKVKSWHYWLYRNTYQGTPKSLCPYFWKLLFAIIMLPLTWVGYLFPGTREGKNMFLNFIITFMFMALLVVGHGVGMENYPESNSFIATIIGLGLLTGVSLIIILAGLLIFGLIHAIREGVTYIEDKRYYKHLKELEKGKEPKKYILIEWWKAFKSKYCPKLEIAND